jgi:hypothetical protein
MSLVGLGQLSQSSLLQGKCLKLSEQEFSMKLGNRHTIAIRESLKSKKSFPQMISGNCFVENLW